MEPAYARSVGGYVRKRLNELPASSRVLLRCAFQPASRESLRAAKALALTAIIGVVAHPRSSARIDAWPQRHRYRSIMISINTTSYSCGALATNISTANSPSLACVTTAPARASVTVRSRHSGRYPLRAKRASPGAHRRRPHSHCLRNLGALALLKRQTDGKRRPLPQDARKAPWFRHKARPTVWQ